MNYKCEVIIIVTTSTLGAPVVVSHPELVWPIFESAVPILPGPVDNSPGITCCVAPHGVVLTNPDLQSSWTRLCFYLGFWNGIWSLQLKEPMHSQQVTQSYPELIWSVGEFSMAILPRPVDHGSRIARRVTPQRHILPYSTLYSRWTCLRFNFWFCRKKLYRNGFVRIKIMM